MKVAVKKSFLISGIVCLLSLQAVQAEFYSIVFSGGANAANNHLRYYEETLRMYEITLNELGYDAENVYVLAADGDDDAVDLSDGTNSDWSSVLDEHILSATTDNLETTINTIADQMVDGEDTFLFWSFDHGFNNTYDKDIGPSSSTKDDGGLCAWGENINDEVFADLMAPIADKNAMEAYFFGQCFAQEMADNLDAANDDSRFTAWAAEWDEPSYGRSWVDALADGFEGGLTFTEELGQYAMDNDPSAGSEHPGWEGSNFNLSAVPEPGTFLMLLIGFSSLLAVRRKRKNR